MIKIVHKCRTLKEICFKKHRYKKKVQYPALDDPEGCVKHKFIAAHYMSLFIYRQHPPLIVSAQKADVDCLQVRFA